MLDRWIYNAESKGNFISLFTESFVLIIFLSFINVLLGGNYLFLVTLTSVGLAYPATKYIRKKDHEVLVNKDSTVLDFFNNQIFVFWCFFLATVLAFLIIFPLISDYSFQENFVRSVSGNLVRPDISFAEIFFHNLYVALITFMIAFVSSSGLVFVLVWNASILTYVIAQATTIVGSLSMLSRYVGHGLIEIAGYILIGLAGSLLSYRFERYGRYSAKSNTVMLKYSLYTIGASFAFILVGAIIEVL